METQLVCEKGKNIALSQRLTDATMVSERTMLAFNTQQDLVVAKQEIIDNLRKEIVAVKQSHTIKDPQQDCVGDDMTSNDEPTAESAAEKELIPRSKLIELTDHYDAKIKMISEEADKFRAKLDDANKKLDDAHLSEGLKNGVKECFEFISIHARNSVITNGLLLWADIQRKQHPDSIWKAEAVEKFSSQEITEAKEILWRTVGENILGKKISRQGNSKNKSEVNDLSAAFKKLEDKDAVPMFLCTSGMVAQTPVFDQAPANTNTAKIDAIDRSVKSLIQLMTPQDDPNTQSTRKDASDNAANSAPDTALGDTMAITDTETVPNNNEWIKVNHRNGRFSQKWKDESRNDKHFNLVVSGFEKGTRSLQLVHYVENKDVDVIDCTLLTRREDASFLTFKVTVKHGDDADKIQDPQFWPDGTRTRVYKQPTSKRKPGEKQTSNAGGTSVARSKPVVQKQANDTSRDSGDSSTTLSNPVSNNGTTSTVHQNSQKNTNGINANDGSTLQNNGMVYPQNIFGGFFPVGNMIGGPLTTGDGVGQNVMWGNMMPQHSAAIPMMNPRIDTAQFNRGVLPQNVLYVPSVGKQKQVEQTHPHININNDVV